MNQKTNFDRYLEDQLKNPAFSKCFQNAGKAWDIAILLDVLSRESGMSKLALAEKVSRHGDK